MSDIVHERYYCYASAMPATIRREDARGTTEDARHMPIRCCVIEDKMFASARRCAFMLIDSAFMRSQRAARVEEDKSVKAPCYVVTSACDTLMMVRLLQTLSDMARVRYVVVTTLITDTCLLPVCLKSSNAFSWHAFNACCHYAFI